MGGIDGYIDLQRSSLFLMIAKGIDLATDCWSKLIIISRWEMIGDLTNDDGVVVDCEVDPVLICHSYFLYHG